MIVGRLTLSDRASAGIYEDLSGPEIERVFRSSWGSLHGNEEIAFLSRVIPDEQVLIAKSIKELSDEHHCPLIITTGGTGPSARDVTPEATREVITKELPGFGEIMRSASFSTVPTAILSRATAGIRGASLIVNLPGNPRAIGETLPLLIPAMKECLRHLSEEA